MMQIIITRQIYYIHNKTNGHPKMTVSVKFRLIQSGNPNYKLLPLFLALERTLLCVVVDNSQSIVLSVVQEYGLTALYEFDVSLATCIVVNQTYSSTHYIVIYDRIAFAVKLNVVSEVLKRSINRLNVCYRNLIKLR